MSTIIIFSIASQLLLALAIVVIAYSSNAEEPQGPAALYQRHCAHCHGDLLDNEAGAEWKKVQSVYPALTDVAKKSSAEQMIQVILDGKFDRAGDRAGQTIPVMPSHAHLANETVAAVVNYVRLSAEVGGQVDVETVARIRGASVVASLAPLDAAEYRRADSLYQNKCAGCHAVDRSGRAGTSLYAWAIAKRGGAAAKLTLHFGTPWGMPNWGMAEALSAEQITLLVRYLAMPMRELPEFGASEIAASWVSKRSIATSAHAESNRSDGQVVGKISDLFVSLLHDTGQVMLIDGVSKEVLEVVDAVLAPTDAIRSHDGRFLYVMSRSAEVVVFDLNTHPVRELSRLKVGFEGRSLALSADGSTIAVGAYWPPQVALLQAVDLTPLYVHLTDAQAHQNNRTYAEISQVVALSGGSRFLAVAKAAGDLIVIDPQHGVVSRQHGYPFLRAGSLDVSGRYLLVPADSGKIVVFDTQESLVVRVIDAPGLQGGTRGVSYKDERGRAVWITGALMSNALIRVYTDGHPQNWVARIAESQNGGGTLALASHPASKNVWIDYPLSEIRQQSQSVGVIHKSVDASLIQPKLLDIVGYAALVEESVVRLVHPQLNLAGDEIWLTLWNRQDRNSAIVVMEDETLKPIKVIRDSRLITPIRTFHLPIRTP